MFTVSRFSYKTKQIGQNRKMYCYDNGMIAAKAFQASPNYGRLFENCVAVHLKRKEIEKKFELYYWRNQQGEEVDFMVKRGTEIMELIQACYSLENKKTRDREVRALLKAGKELKCSKLTVLTLREDQRGNARMVWNQRHHHLQTARQMASGQRHIRQESSESNDFQKYLKTKG